MKISMEIKDGKIVLTDEHSGLTSTQKTPTQKTSKDFGFVQDTGEMSNEPDLNKFNEEICKDMIGTSPNIEDIHEIELSETIACISKKSDEDKQTLNLNRFNTGQVAITMETLDKPDIDQIADIDKDIPGYDRIRVFDSMEKTCDITIINDGHEEHPAPLYFIVNRNGIDHEEEMWSQSEIMIYPGEAWKIYNVHELRIRSETQGNKYRITGDDIIVGSTIRSVV